MSSARFPAAGSVRPYNADFKMEAERINQINNLCDDLAHRLAELRGIFDVDRKERRLEEVNREVENPALWDDPKRAQEISKEQKLLEDLVGSFKRLSAGITDAKELFNMAIADEDFDGAELVAEEVETFRHDVEKLEFKRMFNKPQDSANCYIEIQAGAGGTEAQDWASMLERMYLRYAERAGFSAKLTEETEGDVAGIKGCTIYVQGEWAYGTLRTETGIHRLVRKSPFDANARRHTSFASVYIYPEIDDSIEITINPADLRVDVFRASAPAASTCRRPNRPCASRTFPRVS